LRYVQPQVGAYESDWDLYSVNNPSSMMTYFTDFALLLRHCAEFGQPVLIHVEPDFWGYVEQRVANGPNSAAALPAAVSRSGYPGLAGFPDTIQGFAQALLHL